MARKRKSEKTLGGNPNRLTLKQHVHSAAAIRRFRDERGCVAVLRKAGGSFYRTDERDMAFCATRVWDERFERTIRKTERLFQEECTIVSLAGDVQHHERITDYWALWNTRADLRENPPEDAELAGITGSPPLTKKQEENIEAKSGAFTRERHLPGRFVASMQAVRHQDIYRALLHTELGPYRWGVQRLGTVEWGVLRVTGSARLVFPDRPIGLLMPINRTTAFVGNCGELAAGTTLVELANKAMWEGSTSHIAGHPEDVAKFAERSKPQHSI